MTIRIEAEPTRARRPRRLPVTTPQTPVGAVARPAVSVPAATTVVEVARTMRIQGVSALLVDEDRGVVTEHDITRAVAGGIDPDEPVRLIATTHILGVEPHTPVVECAALMLNAHTRHLLVRRPGGATEIVSLREVAAVLLQSADPEVWLAALRQVLEQPSETWLG